MSRARLSDIPLQWKLPLLVGGLLLGLAAALYSAAYLRVRQQGAQQAQERLAGVVNQIAGLLEQQAQTIGQTMLGVAGHADVRTLLREPSALHQAAAFRALRHNQEADSSLVAIVVRDRAGEVVAADGVLGTQLATQLDPRELIGGSTDSAYSGRFRALDGRIYFPTLVRLTAEGEGGPIGYVTFWRRTQNAPSARGPVAQLIGSDALMLIGSRGGAWMSEAGPGEAPMVDHEPESDGLYRYDRPTGPVLAAAADVAGTPWTVVIEFPAAVVTAPAERFVVATAPIGGIILVVGLLLAWLLSRQVVRPLTELTTTVETLGTGARSLPIATDRKDESGRLALAFNRMIERVDGEAEARRASEAQWRLVFDGNPHPEWVYELSTGRMLAVNPAALHEYGYSLEEFLALRQEDIELLPETEILEGVASRRHRIKNGETIEVELTTHDLSFAGTAARFVLAQNVTARSLLETRFRQAQKMQAIGRLAGGVAHDFNNFLTAIGAYAELALEGLEEGDRRRKDLEEIQRASAQANRLTRQLLSFSRQKVVQPMVIDIDSAVHAMGEMLRRLVREDVAVTLKLESRHARVRMDGGHLEQVLMNLVVNARDAMPKGGPITIQTAQLDLDEGSATLHGVTQPGRYAVLSVIDQGSGMTPETKSRIFEPFFTTKGEGHGTGLGLATVYGIATQAGGHITVYSEVGSGSTFRIYLPLVADPAPEEIQKRHTPTGLRGTETILLVEDEAAVRAAAQAALERQGYTVIACPDPKYALAQAELHGEAIALVVTDVVMPGSDGPTLIAELRKRRPGFKALLMSGYAGEALARFDGNGIDLPFIEKPFTVAGLAKKVREVLDG